MKIIVVGCGKIGATIIENLICEGHDITAIDSNAKILNDAVSIIEAMYYGNETPIDEQVEVVFGAREILENELKGKNNKVLYILKRRLLLPIFNWGKKTKAKKSKGDF